MRAGHQAPGPGEATGTHDPVHEHPARLASRVQRSTSPCLRERENYPFYESKSRKQGINYARTLPRTPQILKNFYLIPVLVCPVPPCLTTQGLLTGLEVVPRHCSLWRF